MKKNLLFVIFTFLSTFFNAQNQSFSYEYKFVTDSTARDRIETELMVLNVFSKGSQFYSKPLAEADSMREAEIEKQIKAGNTNIDLTKLALKGKIKHMVEKSYPDYQVNTFVKLGSDEYIVEDSRKQNWKILPEKEKVGEFIAQKATCNFAGRTWTAWFTTEIPIQDGPYKFYGLPGLIIKLEDLTQSHIYELKGIRKLDKNISFTSFREKKRITPLIEVDYKKFKKAFVDYRADPNKAARQLAPKGLFSDMKDASGNPVDMDKVLRDSHKRQMEANKKNNNLLELDLLQ